MEAEQALERSLAIHLRESEAYSLSWTCWLMRASESILPYGMARVRYEYAYIHVRCGRVLTISAEVPFTPSGVVSTKVHAT